ncbi:MAG TPA: hypothetical protein VLD62_11400, partial [Acidimicrobiia bacterium]|nr:hypothetical protein [Acidimicrobiia bacterium]
PILIGGLSPAAIRRAATTCDGWVALQSTDGLDAAALEGPISALGEQADEAGGSRPRVTMQITGSAGRHEEIALHIPALIAVGVDEIIVDVSWADPSGPEAAYETLAGKEQP